MESYRSKFTDLYLEVSNTHVDEMLKEKLQANAELRGLESWNDGLKLEAKFHIRDACMANGSFTKTLGKVDSLDNHKEVYAHIRSALTQKKTPGIDFGKYLIYEGQRTPTKKKTSGIDFGKYLIYEGQGTPSGFRFQNINLNDGIEIQSKLEKDIGQEKVVDVNNNSKPFDAIKTVPKRKFGFNVSNLVDEDEESSFWFSK